MFPRFCHTRKPKLFSEDQDGEMITSQYWKENENLIKSPTWKEYGGRVGVDMKTVHIPFENPSYTDPRRPCDDQNNHIIDWEANEIV